MVVLRPGSSVLKPGVRERQRDLEAVITKYELLLAISQTKNADFASLDLPQLVLRLAECRLCLIRLQRTAWQIDQSGQEPDQTHLDAGNDEDMETTGGEAETMQTTLQDMLEKTRKLYQLPEVAKSVLAVQGEVQVLLETGELLTFCKDHGNAMAAYAEAIRLCYNVQDEATEAILTSKLQKLQRHADALERVESLANECTSDGGAASERSRLKAAFEKFADVEGFLMKDQLQTLAQELDMTDALSNNEIDDIWSQILQSDKTNNGFPASSKISFDKLWRWWVSDAEYNIINLL
ncbi:hypothetical protein PI124_g11472 [Phytophthora idaei]|nr:hypothetical protein PI125_g10979 [Phytophthora idaei]KAG3152902.1 hypothetical protein PI126_g10305 [Phytophthora idaei]KAG3243732.1 hypothetical protein PI124_g11472 [Phytophthora idaei]